MATRKRIECKWYEVGDNESAYVREDVGCVVGRVRKVSGYYVGSVGVEPEVLFVFERTAKEAVEKAAHDFQYPSLKVGME